MPRARNNAIYIVSWWYKAKFPEKYTRNRKNIFAASSNRSVSNSLPPSAGINNMHRRLQSRTSNTSTKRKRISASNDLLLVQKVETKRSQIFTNCKLHTRRIFINTAQERKEPQQSILISEYALRNVVRHTFKRLQFQQRCDISTIYAWCMCVWCPEYTQYSSTNPMTSASSIPFNSCGPQVIFEQYTVESINVLPLPYAMLFSIIFLRSLWT